MTDSKSVTHLLVLLVPLLTLTGCSPFLKSPLPGVRNKISTHLPNGVEYSTVLTAIKLAIAEALQAVRELQLKNPKHPISSLRFQTGNAMLTTVIQTEAVDSGGITMLIPFSNLTGTQATPGLLGLARAATRKQVQAMEFSIEPASLYNAPSKNSVDDVKIRNGMRDALLAEFQALLSIPPGAGVLIHPRKITLTFGLSLVRTGSGGVIVSIVPTTPTIRNIGPSLGTKRTDITTNDLVITLPLAFPTPTSDAQPVQFLYEVHGTKGSAWILSPYTEAELEKIIGKRVNTVPPERLPVARDANNFNWINPNIMNNSDNPGATQPPLKPTAKPAPLPNPRILRDPPGF